MISDGVVRLLGSVLCDVKNLLLGSSQRHSRSRDGGGGGGGVLARSSTRHPAGRIFFSTRGLGVQVGSSARPAKIR